MKGQNTPSIPEQGSRPRLRDLYWLALFSIRGLSELIRARWIFRRLRAREIVEFNEKVKIQSNPSKELDPALLARIGYVIPRISDRLPWRSDCIVQAIAAQNWLRSHGVASEIQIGVENPQDSNFGAHAWLIYADNIVVGGDISRYKLILGQNGGT